MTTSGISDRTSPDSTKLGAWLFRHRTALSIPQVLALLFVRFNEVPFSWAVAGAGVAVTAAGELIRLWGVRHIGAISRTRSDRLGPLIASGPFAFVRNPLYLGNILLWAGFAISARLVWLAPLLVVLLAAEYQAIVRWEEQLLESRLGDRFAAYAAQVPRWVPRWRAAPPLGSGSNAGHTAAPHSFSWRATIFSERGTLIAMALGYLLLWTKARF